MESARRSGRRVRHAWLLAVPLLFGCRAAELRAAYLRTHPGCQEPVFVERPHQPGVFDASGCGDEVMYRACVDRMVSGSVGLLDNNPGVRGGRQGSNCMFHPRSDAVEIFVSSTRCQPWTVRARELGPAHVAVEGCGVRRVYEVSVGGWLLVDEMPVFAR